MQGLEEILKTITGEMYKALAARTVVGDPVTIEGNTIVPLASIGMGFGAGVGADRDQDKPGGAGGGGGLGIKPVAVIIINSHGARVEMLKPHKSSIIAELVDVAPKLAESFSMKKSEVQAEVDQSQG
jgi:uncharacterized spore protein YtfJ